VAFFDGLSFTGSTTFEMVNFHQKKIAWLKTSLSHHHQIFQNHRLLTNSPMNKDVWVHHYDLMF
jgi:hypothetical protein